ncbi:hypothetical protein FOBRF1_010152 [Fusarium oxysporum]
MDHTLISQAIAGGIALWMNYVIRSSLIAEDVPPTSWVPPHQPTLALSVEYLRYMSKITTSRYPHMVSYNLREEDPSRNIKWKS